MTFAIILLIKIITQRDALESCIFSLLAPMLTVRYANPSYMVIYPGKYPVLPAEFLLATCRKPMCTSTHLFRIHAPPGAGAQLAVPQEGDDQRAVHFEAGGAAAAVARTV